jgi:hypothetical protein
MKALPEGVELLSQHVFWRAAAVLSPCVNRDRAADALLRFSATAGTRERSMSGDFFWQV